MPKLPKADPTPDPTDNPQHPYDRFAIFDADGPIQPDFMIECVRTLFRTLPLETGEPDHWANRRMQSALLGLAALHPRDEIEVMLGVQALSAYHAAAACWRLGMNHHRPRGDSTRHMTTAASAARTFDTLLKALERRQARPLSIPIGRPPSREWDRLDCNLATSAWAARAAADPNSPGEPHAPVIWTLDQVAAFDHMRALAQAEEDNAGLDLENTEGILPGGGIIVPEEPTPQQEAYIARRLVLRVRREYEANMRRGIKKLPSVPRFRTGDLIE